MIYLNYDIMHQQKKKKNKKKKNFSHNVLRTMFTTVCLKEKLGYKYNMYRGT
jgi:hypothetical protein